MLFYCDIYILYFKWINENIFLIEPQKIAIKTMQNPPHGVRLVMVRNILKNFTLFYVYFTFFYTKKEAICIMKVGAVKIH